MIHHLKIYPEYFQAVIDNKKPFDIRRNDRNFKSGDKCILKEFEGIRVFEECPDLYSCDYYREECPFDRDSCQKYSQEIYTGRDCLIKIKDVFPLDKAGIKNYVAFTFELLNVREKK